MFNALVLHFYVNRFVFSRYNKLEFLISQIPQIKDTNKLRTTLLLSILVSFTDLNRVRKALFRTATFFSHITTQEY